MDMISFDAKDIEQFADLYNQAVAEQRESFQFKEQEFLVSYAYYLLQYFAQLGYVELEEE